MYEQFHYFLDACDVDNGGCEWKCEKDDNEEVVCTCPENSDLKFDEKNCEGEINWAYHASHIV